MSLTKSKIKQELESNGFDYPTTKKQDIFNNIITHLTTNEYILNLNDLFVLANTDEQKVIEIFNKEFVDTITREIAKNNINLKHNSIRALDNNFDATSKKILLQLTSNTDEYLKISNQWQVSADDLDEWEIEEIEWEESQGVEDE